MIVDVNAALGPYPFRALENTEPAALLRTMDRHGIARAVVGSLPAVFYRDTHRGNEQLRELVRGGGGRLVPTATVNPTYAGWERDLEEAVARWGMKGVALYPEHHGYALDGAPGRAALARIAALGVPLILKQRLEDRRQRHAWDRAEDLALPAVLAAAKAQPDLRIALLNWGALDGAKLAEAGLRGRCLVDFSRLQVVLRHDVPKLIAALGPEAVAFGTHAPFDYAGGSLIKLSNLERLYPEDAEKFAGGNATRFFAF